MREKSAVQKGAWTGIRAEWQVNKQNSALLEIRFNLQLREGCEYAVAFSHPWGYAHNQRYLDSLEELCHTK